MVTATAAQIVTEHCKLLLLPSHPIFGPWLDVLVRVCVFLEVIGSSSGLASSLLNVTLRDQGNVPTSDKCGHMARSADTQLCLVQSVCVLCMVPTGEAHFDVSSCVGTVENVGGVLRSSVG